MEITSFIDLISTLGFPIACVIAMGVFIYHIYKKSEEREERLLNELSENRKINADAIATIGRYADSITIIENDIKDIKSDLTILTEKIN